MSCINRNDVDLEMTLFILSLAATPAIAAVGSAATGEVIPSVRVRASIKSIHEFSDSYNTTVSEVPVISSSVEGFGVVEKAETVLRNNEFIE